MLRLVRGEAAESGAIGLTPDLPHAARRLLASPDWQALKPALLAYAGREPADGGAVRSCGRYDLIAYVEWIAGQAPEVSKPARKGKA